MVLGGSCTDVCVWVGGRGQEIGLLGKGARLHAASTGSGRDAVQAGGEGVGAVVRFVDAVAAHAVGAAVEVG